MKQPFTNDLIKETSPYLLQHAHNPVDWYAWNEQTLEKAIKENKLILISVGYSACHWCHVMEHESFEDAQVAQTMNAHFINIKVDREERPDVDNVYMNAVQLMTGSGGWPLNVIALPDGRPVWGGTYFPKQEWVEALSQVAHLYETDLKTLQEYAAKLENGLQEASVITPNTQKPAYKIEKIQDALSHWSRQWDTRQGGLNRSPKFMMPTNYHFLLRYADQNQDQEILEYVQTTLEQIAFGGINDHVGGGFARYSTDHKWHIPHFEKMLYDNAQLVSLFAEAYSKTKNALYKEVVYDTLQFIDRELTTTQGSFYSALDADSLTENDTLEEGAYYRWTNEELAQLIGDDLDLLKAYYNINSYGIWENGFYVLIRQDTDVNFCKEFDISQSLLQSKKNNWRSVLLRFRESTRKRPRLDDKILTSWNSLMTTGYVDAYCVFKEEKFITAAIKNGEFIIQHLLRDDGGLNRTYKNGASSINGYLEDYATTITAFIALFEATTNEKWLNLAKNLMDYVVVHFQDDASQLFYFTSKIDPSLALRTIEYYDNVIPASNSIMARNIYKLSHYYSDTRYKTISNAMLNNMQPHFMQSPTSFSNWMNLALDYTLPYYQLVIVGRNAKQLLANLNSRYLPNTLMAASEKQSDLPIFKDRYVEEQTLIYVCVDNTCRLPVKTIQEALELIKF